MYRTVQVDTEQQWERFRSLGAIAAEEVDALPRRRADAFWLLESSGGCPVARCGVWWNGTAVHEGLPTGVIGHYYAEDLAAGAQMLHFACSRLKGQGCRLAVGPMDGSTWRRYRLVTERLVVARDDHPPFFLEPDNPDSWSEHFLTAGFSPVARFHSSLVTDLSLRHPLAQSAQSSFESEGGVLRSLRMDHFDDELQSIYSLSSECFRHNPFFTPLSWEEFQTLYGGLREGVRPELVLLAERAGKLIGLVFAMPDLVQLARNGSIDTVVIKSLAVSPDSAGAGLGSVLVDRCHRVAQQSGFRRVIHATMHDGNYSARISQRTASVFRRYALYGKRLQGEAE